jgi:predicted MPP superfamily phosphohydrolase
MNLLRGLSWPLAVGAGASAATLVYGTLTVSNQLVLEARFLPVPDWPNDQQGVSIAVLADLHIGAKQNTRLQQNAVEMALFCEPDFVAIPGDIVGFWNELSFTNCLTVLEPLKALGKRVILVPGNHDHYWRNAWPLDTIAEQFGFTLLRNEARVVNGVQWLGIDSSGACAALPEKAAAAAQPGIATVCLWHEPDPIDSVDLPAHLVISGHSHGGQFTFPWGWTPMCTKLGARYLEGFFPDARTPLYVSRGVGTTGFPSRLVRLPEVSYLVLATA